MIKLKGYRYTETVYETPTTIVYRGIRVHDNRPVAIKMLKSELPNKYDIELIEHDYYIAKKLNHSGIIKPYALGSVAHRKVYVMEDFGGIPLNNYVLDHKPDLTDQLIIIKSLIDALNYLHQRSYIHKDIKPQNILIDPKTKQLKIIDFSITAEVQKETMGALSPDKLEGTLAYISPEQTGRMNRSIDFRSDFYSLGVTFYELLTGKLPFEAKDQMELVHAHIAIKPVPPHKDNNNIPKTISDIVIKLMAKTAENRYQGSSGLKADVEKCYKQLKESGKIEDFVIGSLDIPDQFQIPEKLYGREKEIEHLLENFYRVSVGSKEMVYYLGASGIGKSSLIKEIHKPLVDKRGYFISGKYDQFKRSIPYNAIIEAFEELARHIITEDEIVLSEWRQNILEAIGDNGQVIIDFIPSMELIIGQQPQIQPLAPVEAQNRFNLVFQSFIRVFAAQEHPLIIFLDDLQWADSASLKLLEILLPDPELSYLLFIGAYRDNEVDATHSLEIMFDYMREEGSHWEDITLTALSQEDITEMLVDIFYCDKEKTTDFANLIHNKTGGNPFFVTEFLKTLYRAGFIEFKDEWKWDIAGIEQLGITANVVEFMAEKIRKLSADSLEVIKQAAVIGNSFAIKSLADVYGKTEDETHAHLLEPMNEGMILFIEDQYRFVHDKVREGAYSLLENDERIMLHYGIAKTILNNAKEQAHVDERIFDIANQFNHAKELIQDAEKKDIIGLNFKAGQKAKAASAFSAAVDFFSHGGDFLPDDSWQSDYDATLSYYTEWSEAEYMAGHYGNANLLFEKILSSAKTILDKIRVFSLKISSLATQKKHLEAIAIGREALKQLNLSLPKDPGDLAVSKEIFTTKLKLGKRKIKDLINLPEMTDKKIIAAMHLLTEIGASAYQVQPKLLAIIVSKVINLSLKYGNSLPSTIAYSGYSVILASISMNELDSAYEFGKLAMELADKYGIKSWQGKTYFNASHSFHYKVHLKEMLKYYLQIFQYCMESGELQYLGYAYSAYCYTSFLSGQNLDELNEVFQKYSVNVYKMKQAQNELYFNLMWQIVLTLSGGSNDKFLLQGKAFDEEKVIGGLDPGHDMTTFAHYYCYKTMLYYLYGDYENCVETGQNEKIVADGVTGQALVPTFYFYYALGLAALYLDPVNKKRKHLKTLTSIHKMFKKWAEQGVYNYLHKFHLISAELARIKNKQDEAMTLYDKAIREASKNTFIHEEAIANECAARFYIAMDDEYKAGKYMTAAYYCYEKWGAIVKVNDLIDKYPTLIKTDTGKGDSSTTKIPTETATGIFTTTDSLDISTVMKATQAISGEIEMEKLLEKLIKIVIENAGAQKGILILLDNEEFLIEAESEVDKEHTSVMKSLPLIESDNIPQAVIRYVAKVKENIVLNNASEEDLFKSDPYIINHQPKSVLCSPILKQSRLIGVIYLENNLAIGAFTEDRVRTLNILSSQIAISIENVKLIEGMKESERLKQEMEIAERIQTSLLPDKNDDDRFEIAAEMKTADEVGGDYYDFRRDAHGTLWFAIGDVTGHGVTPGLIMMMSQTSLANILNNKKATYSPKEILNIINKTLFDNVRKRLNETHFMTFTLFKYSDDGTLSFAGAHLDIIVYRHKTGVCECIKTKGLYLNIIENISKATKEFSLQLDIDDIMVLYSDGIIEARNEKKEFLDMKGLINIIETNAEESTLEELKDAIIKDTLDWCNHKPLDDISLVVARRVK